MRHGALIAKQLPIQFQITRSFLSKLGHVGLVLGRSASLLHQMRVQGLGWAGMNLGTFAMVGSQLELSGRGALGEFADVQLAAKEKP